MGQRQARGSTASLVALGLLFVTLVPYSAYQYWNPKWATSRAWTALSRADVDAAKKASTHATSLAPNDGEVLLLRARLDFDDPKAPKAFELYSRAFSSFDDDAALALSKAWSSRMDDIAKTGLCHAALAKARSNHEVLNNCAWHWLTARNLNERHPARALALAQRARDLYAKPDGTFTVEPAVALAYLHTLAMAWSENGDDAEAEAILERVIAQELGHGWLNDRDAFVRAELTALQQKHELRRRQNARAKRGTSKAKRRNATAPKDAEPNLESGATADAGAPASAKSGDSQRTTLDGGPAIEGR